MQCSAPVARVAHTGPMDHGKTVRLRAKVCDVLWELDPAGVRGEIDWPDDEYDLYIDLAVKTLAEHGTHAAARTLAESLEERMGIEISTELIRSKFAQIETEVPPPS